MNAEETKNPFSPRRAVERSAELSRILGLPRRQWEPRGEEYVAKLTEYLRQPQGRQRLRPVQAAALVEMHDQRGLLMPASVSAGKCVCAGTEVFDARTGRRRAVEEIGAFSTVTLNSRGQFVIADTVAMPSEPKPCVRVTLANGMEINLSFDHPVFTARGWVRASELQENDLVGAARSIPDPERFLEITDDEVKLVAYLLADGNVSRDDATYFCDDNEKVLSEMYGLCGRLCGGTSPRKPSGKATQFCVLGAKTFRQKWGIHGLSKHKRVPAELYGMHPRQIALFLNRFWACDGYHNAPRTGGAAGFEVCLASERFIDDLRFLLLRIGVQSRKHYKRAKCQTGTFDSWRLSINGAAAKRFYEIVGPVWGSEWRSDEVYAHLCTTQTGRGHNTNVDIVPVGYEHRQMIFAELGWPERPAKGRANGGRRLELQKFAHFTQGQYLSRAKWAAVCEKFGYKGSLAWLAESDLAWEYVKSVASIGTLPTYDLSVPGYGNFVANGIVVHNTLTSLLGFVVLEARRPLLLMPAKLIAKTYREAHEYRKHWIVPGFIRIESYEKLGRLQHASMLEDAQPDVIIADECHKLKSLSSAVTKRVGRYLKNHPEVVFVGLSGTVMKRSINDYSHLVAWALRDKSPAPLTFEDRMAWGMALDEKREGENRLAPGALIEFCTHEEKLELGRSEYEDALGIVRRAYRRRVTDTPGIVATDFKLLGTSLRIENVRINVPTNTQTGVAFWQALEGIRNRWERPDGEPLMDGFEVWRHLREVALGFFYRWDPPPPKEWKAARQMWAWFVREILRSNRREIDSEAQAVRAIERGEYDRSVYDEWKRIQPIYTPRTEAVWLDHTALDFCAKWLRGEAEEVEKDTQRGICWVEHTEFGFELSRRTGLPYYHRGGMNAAGQPIEAHPPGEPLIASIASNAEGRNLQAWNTALVASPPQAGRTNEQLLGRLHRDGQQADEVVYQYLTVIPEQLESLKRAIGDAQAIQDLTGQPQKLVYGDVAIEEFGGLASDETRKARQR